jgi:hypothetical protein
VGRLAEAYESERDDKVVYSGERWRRQISFVCRVCHIVSWSKLSVVFYDDMRLFCDSLLRLP